MAEYDSAISTATRLILQKGRPVSLIPPGDAVNVLKPWLGQADGAGIPAQAVFVKDERPAQGSAERRQGECLLAADPAYGPETSWKLGDTGFTWNINKVAVVAPGLQSVIYRLSLDQ